MKLWLCIDGGVLQDYLVELTKLIIKKKKIHTPFKWHATIVSGVDCLGKSIKIKDENINMVQF